MLEINEYEIFDFPKPPIILSELSETTLLNMWLDVKQRLDLFQYKGQSNDIREDYQQFMNDYPKFIDIFRQLILAITDAMKYYRGVKEHTLAMLQIARKQKKNSELFTSELLEKGIDPIDPLATCTKIEAELSAKLEELNKRKKNMEKVEEEIAISEQMLQEKKSEMQLALQSRYSLTPKQKQTLLEEKDLILDGIEEWGSVSGACAHNKDIKSKPSTIHMYCQKFPEFGAAIEVSRQLFKDRLEAIMVERAIEGTENPQFGKGEYIGDYKIKDNKMFLELMKAKMPEVYNQKSTKEQKTTVNNTMNIISFADVDETKEGYIKDVGVVLDVDDTGKVQRITQEKKMLEFYNQKEGAEVILPKEGDTNGTI